MPTPKKGARLGGSPAHQKLILSNLAAQLIEHRAITTTEAKAKVLRPYVEKLITKAKRGDQHARRTVMKKIPNKGIVAILFEELVPAMDSERAGGYTRLIRVGNRKGDNAPLMRIELVMLRRPPRLRSPLRPRKPPRLPPSVPRRLVRKGISRRPTRPRRSLLRPARQQMRPSRLLRRSDEESLNWLTRAGHPARGVRPLPYPVA